MSWSDSWSEISASNWAECSMEHGDTADILVLNPFSENLGNLKARYGLWWRLLAPPLPVKSSAVKACPYRLWINRMAWGQGVLTYLPRLNAPPSQSPFCQGEGGWLGTGINLCNKVQRCWTWSLWIYQRAADLGGGGGAGGPPPQCESATVCITDISWSWGRLVHDCLHYISGQKFKPHIFTGNQEDSFDFSMLNRNFYFMASFYTPTLILKTAAGQSTHD